MDYITIQVRSDYPVYGAMHAMRVPKCAEPSCNNPAANRPFIHWCEEHLKHPYVTGVEQHALIDYRVIPDEEPPDSSPGWL